MTVKTDADILAEAREYLRDHGWTQGTLKADIGQVCALGAILHSQGWTQGEDMAPDCQQDAERIVAYLAKVIIPGVRFVQEVQVSMLTGWNDSIDDPDGIDVDVVLDAFMKAEKLARSGNVEE